MAEGENKVERRSLLLLSGLLIFALVSVAGCGKKPVAPGEGPGQISSLQEEEPRIIDPLTGQRVNRIVPLLAVMVDNEGEGRPQTGLGDAGFVYEIETEGAISRFMALYAGNPPPNVGPVRSARTYFLRLVQEWGAYFAHVGGSADARENIYRWGIRNLDDFRGDRGFWLDQTRRRPHNTYLSIARALEGKQPAGNFKNLVFCDPPEDLLNYREISFSYSRDNRVTYRFSPDKKQYLRYINGVPHRDRVTGYQLAVTNVVIQYVPHFFTGDELGHIKVNLIGQGRAEFFLAGRYEEGSWEKTGPFTPTKFYGADGQEVSFVQGNTWIQVLRPGTPVHKT